LNRTGANSLYTCWRYQTVPYLRHSAG